MLKLEFAVDGECFIKRIKLGGVNQFLFLYVGVFENMQRINYTEFVFITVKIQVLVYEIKVICICFAVLLSTVVFTDRYVLRDLNIMMLVLMNYQVYINLLECIFFLIVKDYRIFF